MTELIMFGLFSLMVLSPIIIYGGIILIDQLDDLLDVVVERVKSDL